MKPIFIESKGNLDGMYFDLLWRCYRYGRKYEITEGSFKGHNRLEFDHVSGFIHDPHRRPLAPIFPQGVPPVTTDEDIETYFADYLMNPNLSKNEEYKYATWINKKPDYPEFCEHIKCKDWYSNHCVSDYCEKRKTPIEWVISHFQQKGYGNNHCYLNIGDVYSNYNYDIPYTNENDRKTSPCLRGLDFKIKDNKLILHVIYRSWDLYAGFPVNMGGFALLNQYVAEHLDGVVPGPLSYSCSGLHCYDYQLEPLRVILNV